MRAIILTIVFLLLHRSASAEVTIYTNKAQWQAAAGGNTKIDFLGFPEFTVITDQYAEQGVSFTDGNDFIFTTQSFPADGAGLVSASDVLVPASGIYMHFDQPRNAIAIDFIGRVKFELFANNQLFHVTNDFWQGFTPFVGIVSSTPIDTVLMWDSLDAVVSIDNVYFGGPVPAPGGAFIMICGLAATPRRRRQA